MPKRTKSTKSTPRRPKGPVRYAVIGLGHIAQAAVLPAFKHARRNSALAALVSSETKKLKELGRRYGVTHLYDYDDVDDLFASGEVDAVYIALPNDLHKDYAIKPRARAYTFCVKSRWR